MSETFKGLSFGWVHDYPDFRDYTPDHEKIAPALKQAKLKKGFGASPPALPAKIDLSKYCSPIEDQQDIGSCTAHAGMGLLEYFERRATGKHIDGSRLFLYKVTRDLLGWTGDTGAYLRTTAGAMRLFGVPPETYWEYDTARYEEEPPAFLFAFAQNYQALKFYRLDPAGTKAEVLHTRIKATLGAGLPSMFGFTCYSSLDQSGADGKIPYPAPGEGRAGGHAVVAIGYDDGMKITNPNPGGGSTKGAYRIRNSWGSGWGEDGYGWLPYRYVEEGLAVDWWSLIENEWVDTGQFGL